MGKFKRKSNKRKNKLKEEGKKSRDILFLTPFYDNTCGVGTSAQALANVLKERGNKVDILEYSPWKDENPYNFFLKNGEKFSFSDSNDLLKFIQDQNLRYDVLHSHNQVFSDLKNEKLMKYFRNTPLLTQVHMGVPYSNEVLGETSPHGEAETLRQARMFGRSDKVIHLSEDLQELIGGYYGVENAVNTSVIYNFAKAPVVDKNEVDRLRKRLSPNGEKIFLYAGRLSEEKGALELIKGFKEAKQKNPEIKLVICGGTSPDQKFMNELNQEMKSLEEGKDYSYEGRVTQNELQNYYSASDFFVQPSRFEHFSISLIEAMAHNKPIVMTKVPSMRKVMKLDESDMERYAIPINELNSPNEIFKAIDLAANASENSLESMVKRASEFYKNELTPERIAEKYEIEYDSLINSKKKNPHFENVYAIPVSSKDKNLNKTVNSILEKEDNSQIIISPYGGYNLGEDFIETYKELITQGKIKILTSDARITKNKSNALNKAILEGTKVGAEYMTVILPNHLLKYSYIDKVKQLKDSELVYSIGEEGDLEKTLRERNPIHQSETTYQHSAFDKAEGFWDYLGYAEDMDMYQKMLNRGMSLSKYNPGEINGEE